MSYSHFLKNPARVSRSPASQGQEHLVHASFNTTAKYRKIASEEHKAWFDKLWQ